MATCKTDKKLDRLDLPREFEEIEGLVRADLRAVVAMIADRANERLLLTRREYAQLQANLWNRLVGVVNQTVEPLSADRR